ncbi:hypothetical protein PI93_017510 [Pandoraea fibrosis]|uniref:Uncharacterized protein n=1 Tax=Pandoraea fibrosis TaxID=1891094 RepID=A0ABX6HTK6_9BURK|nr:hypothetical protein [Pandoraea fibrosis]QHE92197.1 hypothetical protein PJ20_010490 [Pandoraea fibrosis]QHF14246.1 hypothetical protein PI93_017510 [Pandoraea fibrosis]
MQRGAVRDLIDSDTTLTRIEIAALRESHQGYCAEIESWTSKAEQYAKQRAKAGEVVKRHLHKI